MSGRVTINRADTFISQPSPGELLYQGDLIVAGVDGEVSILCVDGTCIALTPASTVELEGFSYEPGAIDASACFRAVKGRFAFLGGEIARRGRFIVDTPKAKIRNTGAAGLGAFAFAFLLSLVEDARADSEEITLFDDDLLSVKEVTHGVFEIITTAPIRR